MTAREFALGLYGAWRLAHFDPLGMGWFDRSEEGFWRSFQVAIYAAPAYAVLAVLSFQFTPPTVGWTRIVAVEGIAYVIGWVAYPLAVFYLAPLVDRQSRYVGYVVAYNWANLLQPVLLVPIGLLAASGLLPERLGMAVQIAASLAVLVYFWFVAKAGLELGGLTAAGFVLVDFTLGYFLTAATNHLLGVVLP